MIEGAFALGKTRIDHECDFCGEVIPSGTPVEDLYHEDFSFNRFTVDIKPLYIGKSFGRSYMHKNCKIINELCGKKDYFSSNFWVQRGVTEIIYHIRNIEIQISLFNGDGKESWNKAVEKDNEIYEFCRVNKLSMHPELSLKVLQEV